jgi:hypothetical protein
LHSEAYVANLLKFPPKHPLFLISDDAGHNPSRLIKNPELIGRRPPHALNNYLWFSALQLAKDVGLDFGIYMESDSRVGRKDWDTYMFEEFFGRYPSGLACAGTPVAWDICSGGGELAKNVIEQAWQYQQLSGLPASFYSSKHPYDNSGACYYPNGSLMIFETAAMLKIFDGFLIDIAAYSKHLTAFDMAIGKFLWNYHGPKAIQHVGWLACSYSAFGDAVTTPQQRIAMLTSGSKVAIHQWKMDGPEL